MFNPLLGVASLSLDPRQGVPTRDSTVSSWPLIQVCFVVHCPLKGSHYSVGVILRGLTTL